MSTIDPGLEETLKQTSNDVEADGQEREEEEAEEEEQDFRDPSRWWFASTACPLLAGTFGPIASGFNICALVYKWRLYVPPGGSEIHGLAIEDPAWEVALNAVSLLAALVGNMSLLLNMAKRVRFSVAQPITITGFMLASVLLIADLAAMSASPTYWLTGRNAQDKRHALSQAFYYAIFAAVIYMAIGLLMCWTVYGALKGYYERNFRLTPSQRTLMLQTMAFVTYLLLGALVFSKAEGWNYLVAVYWADVTLLTVGLGDYSPATNVGRGLLFPFALGGILIIGLVIGSIRSLVLERGKEKLGARLTEKRRSAAVHNVDTRKQTIKVSWFASADFSTDPALSPAQRREEEFTVMRKVQDAAERERRYFSLATSGFFALMLWFVGAAIFMVTEHRQQWTYFNALYFTYACLLTIGYGDLVLLSNSGRAFFVIWSILAVPSLTILISNMGDTIVKWFSDATDWIGAITVLPDESGFRAGAKELIQTLLRWGSDSFKRFSPPGLFGDVPRGQTMRHEKRMGGDEHENLMMDRLAERLGKHMEDEEMQEAHQGEQQVDQLQRDMHFYHYVLARECRNLQKDLSASPPKQYTWQEWEYYLKLMGNEDDPEDFPGQEHPDIMVPDKMKMTPSSGSDATMNEDTADENADEKAEPPLFRSNLSGSNTKETADEDAGDAQTDGVVGRRTELKEWKEKHEANKHLRRHPDKRKRNGRQLTTMDLRDWSWLSNQSPLMGTKTESEWILERLSAALERELNRQRKGYRRQPPISMSDVRRHSREEKIEDAKKSGKGGKGVKSNAEASGEVAGKEEESLEKAAKSEG